jgi:hypothetical protein
MKFPRRLLSSAFLFLNCYVNKICHWLRYLHYLVKVKVPLTYLYMSWGLQGVEAEHLPPCLDEFKNNRSLASTIPYTFMAYTGIFLFFALPFFISFPLPGALYEVKNNNLREDHIRPSVGFWHSIRGYSVCRISVKFCTQIIYKKKICLTNSWNCRRLCCDCSFLVWQREREVKCIYYVMSNCHKIK